MKPIISIPANHSILIVEDSEERINWFKMRLRPENGLWKNVTVCMTPEKALNVLGVHKFDIVFLDHDCIRQFVSQDDPLYEDLTFWRVTAMLSKTNYDGTVIIHSQNPVGAERMRYMLARTAKVYKMPFGSFEIGLA